MTDIASSETSPPSKPMPRNERIVYGLRQAGFLAIALLVAAAVTNRLDPAPVSRGIATTPFLWAAVVWLVVLLFNAAAFEQSQTAWLEGWPMLGGLAAGFFVFLSGLIALDGGNFIRRAVYAFSNALGAIMFWWAALSLALLVSRRLAAAIPASPGSD